MAVIAGMAWFFCLGSIVTGRAIVSQITTKGTSLAEIFMALGGLSLLAISIQKFI